MNNCTLCIIDDNDTNINICKEILEDEGAKILSAQNGRTGLELVQEVRPDVILLDIMMPLMDGFEVLSLLKEDKALKHIPVLMLTARSQSKDIVKALDMGANDYLVKPFIEEELVARVKTLCRLKLAEDHMRSTIAKLRQDTTQLAHKAELGVQAGELAHDLNNVMAVSQLITLIPDMLDDPENHDTIRTYLETSIEAINLGSEISSGYISYLKDMGQEPQIQSLEPLFRPLSMFAKTFKGRVVLNIPHDLPCVTCKADQMKRVIVNLFMNASQAVDNSEDGIIECNAWSADNRVCFSIRDNGCGITEDILPHIFEECFTTKKHGTGLGLYMVKQAIEEQSGTITVSSSIEEGTVFTVSLPEAEMAAFDAVEGKDADVSKL